MEMVGDLIRKLDKQAVRDKKRNGYVTNTLTGALIIVMISIVVLEASLRKYLWLPPVLALFLQVVERVRDRSAWSRWAQTRNQAEQLISLKFLYIMQLPPFDKSGAELILNTRVEQLLQGTTHFDSTKRSQSDTALEAPQLAIDSEWISLRNAPACHRECWYLHKRVEHQSRWYSDTAFKQKRQARNFKRVSSTLWVLLLVVGGLAALNWVPTSLDGPILTVIVAIKAWLEGRKVDELSSIYSSKATILERSQTTIENLRKLDASHATILAVIESVENEIYSELTTWKGLMSVVDESDSDMNSLKNYTMKEAHRWVSEYGDLYRSAAPPVMAQRLDSEHHWETDTGNQATAKRGDWLLNSGQDEWTVNHEVFIATYKELEPGKYQKTARVFARELDREITTETEEGIASGKPGEMILAGPLGTVWIQSKQQFTSRYEPIKS